ncbi:BUB1 N-terminal domain-containing protein [Aphelenchoides fujianensis]|nr:BUB1 N-terminal domain-containing protein [Aphelenchoides fujianensis]
MPELPEDFLANVENLRPVRRGRRAATLGALCSRQTTVTNREAEEKFRAEWQKADDDPDPLAVLWHFVTWFDEHFPSGRPSLLYPMLYKICTTEMYDSFGNPNKARETLELGFNNRATPVSLLHEAKNTLEMRLMRDAMLQQQADHSDHEEQDMERSGSCAEWASGPKAPMFRIPRGNPGVVRSKLQVAANDSFEVLADEPPPAAPAPSASTAADWSTAREFADDPEFQASDLPSIHLSDCSLQALFGFFFDHAAKPGCHLTISENLHDARRCPKDRPESLAPLPIYGDDFEVYDEAKAVDGGGGDAKPAGSSAQKKARLYARKEFFASGLSIEENFLRFLEEQKLEFPIVSH